MPAPPMPTYDVPGLMQVQMHFIQDRQHVMNNYWVKSNLNITSITEEQLIAGTFSNWWNDEIRPLVSSSLQLYEVVVKELRPDGIAILYTESLPVDGQKSEPALPNSVTLAVHWGTGHVGRSRHGRTYHLGMCEDQVVANTCSVAADIQSAYDALRTTLDNITLNVEFSVVSFVSNKAWRTVPLVTPISGVAVEPTIDNMRRRLPGRGQ